MKLLNHIFGAVEEEELLKIPNSLPKKELMVLRGKWDFIGANFFWMMKTILKTTSHSVLNLVIPRNKKISFHKYLLLLYSKKHFSNGLSCKWWLALAYIAYVMQSG